MGHPACVRLLRGAARRPGDRVRLHLAAEHDAHRVVDQVGRGRQARALREAVHAEPGRRHGRLGRGRPRRPHPVRGVHVAAQSADLAPTRADRRRRDRRGAADPVGVLVLALRRGQHPPADRRRGRRPDGRRVLLRQRVAPRGRGGAGSGIRVGVVRPDGHRLGVHRVAALPRRRARDLRLRHRAAEPRRARGGRQRGLAVPGRSLARGHAGDRAAPRRTRSSGSSIEPANSYRLELENVGAAAAGKAELLLGRDDAMGQARTLEALHRSAQTGGPVSL